MIVASLLLILVAVTLLVLGLGGGSSGLLIASIVASLLAAVALVIGARHSVSARRAAAADPDAVYPEAGAPDDLPPRGEIFAAESAELARSASPVDSDSRETVQFEPVPAAADPRTDDIYDYPAVDEAYDAGRRDAVGAGAYPDEPDHAAPAGHAEATGLADADAHTGAAASEAGPEFAEPDDEDPDDEPLPQAVSPADAVRVARMDAEVLVVDGRPRYHVSDCPHLVGRLTEPIPVNEAVELGFTPCGLCRPVDRLVAAAAHR